MGCIEHTVCGSICVAFCPISVASIVMNKPSWAGVEGIRSLVQKSSACPNGNLPLKPIFARQASIR